jgi:hypothetical protein
MSRYAARVDDNQAEIVEALRKAGATVQSLAEVGRGCPDLLIGYQNKTALIEVKDGAKSPSERKLTPAQDKWHADWRGGTLCAVDNIEAALRVLKVMTA